MCRDYLQKSAKCLDTANRLNVEAAADEEATMADEEATMVDEDVDAEVRVSSQDRDAMTGLASTAGS